MEISDLAKYSEQFADEFARATTFHEFAFSLDASKAGAGRLLQHIATKYPDSWESSFQTLKHHGFMMRQLLMPAAHKATDLFEAATLFPFQSGGIRREDVNHLAAGHAFVSALRAPNFCYFGHLSATYQRIHKGRLTRRISGGQMYLTGAKPKPEVVNAYGADVGAGEWNISTFEAITRDDGRILITINCNNGFGHRWLALLDAGETLLSLMGGHERGEIEAEIERKAAVFNLKGYAVTGTDRQAGALGISEPFETVIAATSPDDARSRVIDSRIMTGGRDNVLILSVTEKD